MQKVCIAISIFLFSTYAVVLSAELDPAAKKTLATIEWVSIPEGEFIMGSTLKESENAYSNATLRSSLLEKHTFDAEVPKHTVYLSAYQISRYEITNAQYRAFIEATGRPTPRGQRTEEIWKDENFNCNTKPIIGITWFDAQAFAEWIDASLPTEAQWERAARGTNGRIYPWGNDKPKTRLHANFARRYNRTTSVGQFPKGATPNGIADLAGNVWEWCLDEYNPAFYQQNTNKITRNPVNLRYRDILRPRVIRGGAWDVGGTFLRSALRSQFYPLDATHNIGFRIVRPKPEIKN